MLPGRCRRNPAGAASNLLVMAQSSFSNVMVAEAQTVAELLDLRAEFASEASQPSNVGSFWNAVGRLARSSQERQWLRSQKPVQPLQLPL